MLPMLPMILMSDVWIKSRTHDLELCIELYMVAVVALPTF